MRPPPSSTLFPYTTLFRSDEARASVRHERERDARERGDPQHRGEVDRRLAADESRDPRRKQLAERVAATQCDPEAGEPERGQGADHEHGSDKAELLAEHREDHA